MKREIKFKIGQAIIQMQSDFPHLELDMGDKRGRPLERFKDFLYYLGNGKPDIIIDVHIADKLPKIKTTGCLFVAYHPAAKKNDPEDWRLLKKGNTFVYCCPGGDKKQVILINKTFNRASAYLLPKRSEAPGRELVFVWDDTDLIYDFLHVLLINYFALHNKGIFVHSTAVKDCDGQGLLFAGKTQAGKSTIARIWHRYSRGKVLNDDRIIVGKLKDRFFVYGTPWHGDLCSHLKSWKDSAPLAKLFFIYHAARNKAKKVSPRQAFSLLYPALFPTFWDRDCLENITHFSRDLVKSVPSFSLGFKNDAKIIPFVRGI